MKKKIVSSILSLVMLLSLLPGAAFAADTTDVVAAPLGVNHELNRDRAKGYADTYDITVTKTKSNYDVAFTATNLKSHKTSKDGAKGYWVGVGIKVPQSATVTTGWGTYSESTKGTPAPQPDGTVGNYSTYYFNVGPGNTNNSQNLKTGFVTVASGTGETATTTVYNLDFTGVKLATPSLELGFSSSGKVIDTNFFNRLAEIRPSSYQKPSDTWTQAGPNLDSEKDTISIIAPGLDMSKEYFIELKDNNAPTPNKCEVTATKEDTDGGLTPSNYDSAAYRATFTGIGAKIPALITPNATRTVTYTATLKEGTTERLHKDITIAQVTLDANGGTFGLANHKTQFADKNKDGVKINDTVPTGEDKLANVWAAQSGDTANKAVFFAQTDTKLSAQMTDNVIPVPAKAGAKFAGWKVTTVAGTAQTNAATQAADAITISDSCTITAQWEDVASPLTAGFEWYGADANTALEKEIKDKLGADKDINDSCDQTVWMLIQRTASQSAANPVSYWYNVTSEDGKTVYFEGATQIPAASRAMYLYMSFLDFRHNTDKVVPEGAMKVNIYKIEDSAYTTYVGDNTKKPTLTGITPTTVDIKTDGAKNPAAIQTLVLDSTHKVISVTMNHALRGRYVAEVTENGTPIKAVTVGTDGTVGNGTTFTTFDITLDNALTPGTYKVSLHPRKGGNIDEANKLTPAVCSKDITINAETISEITIDDPGLSASVSGSVVTITGKTSKPTSPATRTIAVSYTTSEGRSVDTNVVLTATGDSASFAWETPLALFGGTKYTFNSNNVSFLAKNVEIKSEAAGDVKPVDEDAVSLKTGSTTTTAIVRNTAKETTTDFSKDNAVAEQLAAAAPTSTADVTAKLTAANATLAVGAPVKDTIEVVPYLDIEVTNYQEEQTGGTAAKPASITLEITPMIKLQAVKKDVTPDASPVAIPDSEREVANPETIGPVEISFKVPNDFVNGNPSQLFVKHKGYVYTATQYGGSSSTVYKFTNPHGFSTFEIVAQNPAVASTNSTDFLTLQGAIDAVEAGGTINLTNTYTSAGTLSGINKGFTINTSAASLTPDEVVALETALKAGAASGFTVSISHDGDKFIVAVSGSETPVNPPSTGGGGVSSNVTIDRPTNGKVSVTPTAPSKGATVTINLTPDTGYAVGTVTVTDKDGKAVELTKVNDNQYTFTMPDGKVTVKATFTKVDAPATGFTDVAADAYYADAVKWAVDKGITNGLTATTFGPNNSCTRGQMVTFLWRAAGSPAATGTNSFSDVASGEYYYNAVLWAVEKGITNGTSATTFSPNATVNRGQTVTFLYRYAESPAATGDTSFTDVTADAFYADAVKWAVAEEITNGTSSTTFSPASNCTRGQIVTFMYRQMAE